MKEKKKIYIIGGIIVVIIGIFIGILLFFNDSKLVKLDYSDIEEKINNKENFVLCISRTTCSHCNNYKPKLKEVANKYNINIYYTDVDLYSSEDLDKYNSLISFYGSTPVTIFIKNGEEKTTATRIEGDVSTDKIIEKLKKNGFIQDK